MSALQSNHFARAVMLAASLTVAGSFGVASAGTIVPCNGLNCSYSIEADGIEVATGQYAIDPKSGAISLPDQVNLVLEDGSSVSINSLSGNADPILGFSVGAGTSTLGKTFAFSFSLPISLSGPLQASSSVSYSLTSLTSDGAQIQPQFGHVVVAQENDSTVGGLLPLNKGVDVGDTFFFNGGPKTVNSPVYTASSTLTGNLAYDLMSVTLGFTLSPQSNVGLSGFVKQTPVPVPAAAWLLGSALLGLVRLGRRRALV
jgi:hypothetical protein